MNVTIEANPSQTTNSFNYSSNQIFEETLNSYSGYRATPNFVNEPSQFINPTSIKDIVSHCRNLYLNNGIVKSGIDMLSNYAIGNAFKFYSLCENESLKDSYNNFVKDWAKIASVSGESFNDILYQISNAISIDGDCFILLTKAKSGFPQIQFIRANRVRGDKSSKAFLFSKFARMKVSVLNGIIANVQGREIGYIIDDEQVIDARSILHCKDVNHLQSNRGLPLFSHAIKTFRMVDDINSSELLAMKIASQIALVEKNSTGTKTIASPRTQNANPSPNVEGAKIRNMGSGQILYLQEGKSSIESLNVQRPSSNYMQFVERLQREALTGAGLSFDLIVNSENVTGVAIRSELSRFDKTCNDRFNLLQGIASKVFEYVIATAISQELLEHSKGWFNFYVTKPTKPSIDLGRNSAATINEFNAGLKTLEECISPEMTVKEFATIRATELAILESARIEAEKKFKVTISQDAMRKI